MSQAEHDPSAKREPTTPPTRTPLVTRIGNALALLILLVIAGLALIALREWFIHRRERADAHAAAPAPASSTELRLGGFEAMKGTSIFRAYLVDTSDRKEWSYGGRSGARNILFLNADTGATQWVLEDDDHVIVDHRDLSIPQDTIRPTTLVTLALVKPRSERLELAVGDLLLLTATGDKIVKIASDVRELNAAQLIDASKVSIVYERHRKFFLAQYATETLSPLQQHEVTLPKLK